MHLRDVSLVPRLPQPHGVAGGRARKKNKKNQLTNSPSERTPLGLLVLQHEIGHLDQQAALAAHHPDLLELSSHLALPVGQISQLVQRLHLASQRFTRSRQTLSLMKELPRVEVSRQETKRLSVSCVVSMRPKSFGSAMERLAWATRMKPASSAATASLLQALGHSPRPRRCRPWGAHRILIQSHCHTAGPPSSPHTGEELAALRVGQEVSELDRHVWLAAHASFSPPMKKCRPTST